jgi:hypothetical protein
MDGHDRVVPPSFAEIADGLPEFWARARPQIWSDDTRRPN